MLAPSSPRTASRSGLAVLALACALALAAPVAAQEAPAGKDAGDAGRESYYPSVWNLTLGAHAREIPTADYTDFACGTNGGPPATALTGWLDFARCPADPTTGLHEVYFRYDDELEYRGRAQNLDTTVQKFQYTAAYDQPVIASGLFDEDGFMLGLRLVTDPRVPTSVREQGVTLAGYLFARFGQDDWTCTDLPRAEGETEFHEAFIKERCTKTAPLAEVGPVHFTVERHNLRKRGQAAINLDHNVTEGEFESLTRFDAVIAGALPDRDQRLAAIVAMGPPAADPVVTRAMNCPGCDLHGANLKRADLHGANLKGANLAGADLHAANLEGADLSGANLEGANLNKIAARRANFEGANLQKVMLYAATLDGAQMAKADFTAALAGNVRMIRTDLSGARMVAVDLRNGRLTTANFTGVDLTHSWLHDTQLTRANFTNAILIYVVALRAEMGEADLTGVDARGADLFGANLRGSNLTSADLSYTRLTSVNLFKATMEGTNFANSELPAGFTPPRSSIPIVTHPED